MTPNPQAQTTRLLLGVGLLALVIRLAFMAAWPSVQQRFSLSSGSDGYEHVARTLAAGEGFRFAPHLGPTMILPPTYPGFLAGLFWIVGDDRDTQLVVTRIVQSALDSSTCILVSGLAARWFGVRAGLFAGLLYALYPGMWIACARYVTEPLFAFLVTAWIAAFARWLERRSLAALIAGAAACTLAAMCKSVAPLLPAGLLICTAILPFWRGVRRPALGAMGLATLCTAAACTAWVARNYAISGTPVFPSTLGGQALYTATVYVRHPDQSIRDSVDQAAAEMSEIARQNGIRLDPKDAYPRWFYDSRDEVRLDRILRTIAAERSVSDTTSLAQHIAGNLWRFWFGAPSQKAIVFSVLTNGPLLAIGLLGLLICPWYRHPALCAWLAASAYLFLSHIAVLAVVRYSLTVVAVLCVLGGAALARRLPARTSARAEDPIHASPLPGRYHRPATQAGRVTKP